MNIWYDVSGLYNWKGNFTGVQRVVYNLGERLAADNQDARFFIFRHGSFSEIGFDDLESRLAELRREPARSLVGKQTLSVGKLRHHGMVAAKRAIRGSRFEEPLRSAYGGLRMLYRTARTHREGTSTHSVFGSNDIVVVVDGNWQFKGYAEAMAHAHTEVGFRLIHCVNDLVALKNPGLVNEGATAIIGDYFEVMLPSSDSLFAISESTKRDIEWFFETRNIATPPPVAVVTLGSDAQRNVEPMRPGAVPDEFMLSVSTIEVRKNYAAFYYVYKQAVREGIELPHLIIVGRKGWMAEETYALLTKDPEVKDHITIMGGLSDEELEWLYQNCLFTVFPSFYEGWGLPVAESLAHGKYCISSDTSSMPEVGGDLVSYVSPYDTNELLQAINAANNKATLKKQEKRIQSTYHATSWDDAYAQFKKLLA